MGVSSETQGQLVGAKRSRGRNRIAAKVFYKSLTGVGNEFLQTISKRLCECWLLIEQKKNPLFYFA